MLKRANLTRLSFCHQRFVCLIGVPVFAICIEKAIPSMIAAMWLIACYLRFSIKNCRPIFSNLSTSVTDFKTTSGPGLHEARRPYWLAAKWEKKWISTNRPVFLLQFLICASKCCSTYVVFTQFIGTAKILCPGRKSSRLVIEKSLMTSSSRRLRY